MTKPASSQYYVVNSSGQWYRAQPYLGGGVLLLAIDTPVLHDRPILFTDFASLELPILCGNKAQFDSMNDEIANRLTT